MNTIKVYLDGSGQVKEFVKDFSLYKGAYQNKLLNIYVPTAVLSTNYTVKIATVSTQRNGKLVTSQAYYMNLVKTLTKDGVEYALFERLLPKAFTDYTGNNIMVINVVSVTGTTVDQIITSAQVTLEVLASSYAEQEETIEATVAEQLATQITALQNDKQDKQDDTLETSAKTVVGAINENKTDISENSSKIQDNTDDISALTTRVSQIETEAFKGRIYVGSMTVTTLPTESDLNAFVLSRMGRATKNGDEVIVLLQKKGTDEAYEYIYSNSGWTSFLIPTVESAGNGTKGLVQGSYGTSSTSSFLADIEDGIIKTVYIKGTDGSYHDIVWSINTNTTAIEEIIDGTQTVGSATKATQDGEGANISETYLKKADGATKEYVRNYALPKEFNDALYWAGDTFDTTLPEETVTRSVSPKVIGDTDIFTATYTLPTELKFQLAQKNSYVDYFDIAWTSTASGSSKLVRFILTTKAVIGSKETTLATEVSEAVSMAKGELTRVVFNSNFAELTTVLDMVGGNKITQTLSVRADDTVSTFTVYGGEGSPSRMNLFTGFCTIQVASGMLGEILEATVTTVSVSTEKIVFTLPSLTFNDSCIVRINIPYFDLSGVENSDSLPVWFKYETNEAIPFKTAYSYGKETATLKEIRQLVLNDGVSGMVDGYAFNAFIRHTEADFTVTAVMDNLSEYADMDYVREQDTAFIGRQNQVGFTAIIEDGTVKATLDSSISAFEFTNSTNYLFNIHLAVSGELDPTYPIKLYDKDGNEIHINCVFVSDIDETATVNDMKQVQRYDDTTGYIWEFTGRYTEVTQGGTLYRVVYTDTVVSLKGVSPSITYELLSDGTYNMEIGASITGNMYDTVDYVEIIAPSTATNGTLTEEQLNTLLASTEAYILFDGLEYNYVSSAGGVMYYLHETANYEHFIGVNEENGSWVLTTRGKS